jgi:organic hydroperoxide reductase OsmC/OhrA
MRTHHFQASTRWTGNLGSGTSGYRDYSRSHEISGTAKSAAIPGSSDPVFRGDPARYNPEELVVAALSACHMLWVLHLCADAGIVISEYSDEPTGEVREHAGGAGEFTTVTLRPRMTIADPARAGEAIALHERAHHLCCIARSVNFPVSCEPTVTAVTAG